MKKIYLITAILLSMLFQAKAQMGINKDGSAPHPSAILDVKASNSTNAKGILMPRVADHTVITSPATGLMVFNTTTNTFWYYNSLAWTDMGNGGSSGAWLQNGTNVYTNNNKIGINTATPQTSLDIKGDGFLVSTKTKLTTIDPNSNIQNMPLNDMLYRNVAGILYDPSGPNAPYPSGNINTTSTLFVAPCSRGDFSGCNSIGIKLSFEVFDIQTGDSLILSDGTNILFKYSGNVLPNDLFYNGQTLLIRFKTNGDLNVGQGFKIKWQALEYDGGTQTPIIGIVGNSAYFETQKGVFRSGSTSLFSAQNTGPYSTAMGVNNIASGSSAVAIGSFNSSSGYGSVAIGNNNNASGYNSTALGVSTKARGDNSTSLGNGTISSGFTSTAIGYNTTASGDNSTALGNGTIATGIASTVMGYFSNVTSNSSYGTAMGYYTTASSTASFASGLQTISGGYASTSMGNNSNASGYVSTALGNSTNASGYTATALGNGTTASGFASTAMGYSSTASGNNSTAMGSNTNAYLEGSFVIGDSPNSSGTVSSQTSNSFTSRFRNGYYLYTGANFGSGVFINSGGNSWSSISDSTKKENFLPIDGENVLKKIANMRTVTWNYKGQDPKSFRHYGPMAQEFFSAFGRDKLGVIGNDTTIASADFDGINFTAIKALEKRTAELQTENENLKKRVAILEKSSSDIMALKAEMEQLKAFLLPEKEKIRVKVVSDK